MNETKSNNSEVSKDNNISTIPVINPVNLETEADVKENSSKDGVVTSDGVTNKENEASANGGTLITPSMKLPEMKDEVSEVGSVSASGPEPQLSLDSASPFDIGVGVPASGNVSVSETVKTGSDIKNIPVNNSDDKNKVVEDINLSQISKPANSANVVSVGTYMINIFLFSIPVIGLIVLIIKMLDKDNVNVSNFAKAYLLYDIIFLVIQILCVLSLFSQFG